jgi:hypothetical protein
MSNPRLRTPKLRQIIQFESSELSAREVGRALSLSHGAVSKYRCAVRAAGAVGSRRSVSTMPNWNGGSGRRKPSKPRQIVLPDCAAIHTELKRHKHVTLQLLWDEYHATHGTQALRYSAYCERYRHWMRRLQRSMRQLHYAGEKLFVDYAGATEPSVKVPFHKVSSWSHTTSLTGSAKTASLRP